MAFQQHITPALRSTAPKPLIAGGILMAAVVFVGIVFALINSGFDSGFPYIYMLPWLIAMALVMAAPSAYLYYKGRFELYNPIVFATFSYFFPAFVVGGLMVSLGFSQPYFLTFIQDPTVDLPFTAELVIIGFAGLSFGFFTPIGLRAGEFVERYLPSRDLRSEDLLVPGIVLLALGIVNSLAALVLGIIGYQQAGSFESYDGLIFLTTLFWMQGTFLIWFVIFRRPKFDSQTLALSVGMVLVSTAKALLSGNRGGLVGVFLTAGLAFLLAGRKLNFKQSVWAGSILVFCLIGGVIYGTTFRNVKGTESRVSLDQYTDNIFDTFDQVGSANSYNTLEFGLMSLAERIDTLSSVAVVVSNYEKLKPYEESYGLDNNIWKDVSTFFIPRVLWPDKPVASEARKYSDLYFDYAENSFAITPIGDLIRNYGPIGVPIGMFIFGIILRFVYRILIEGQPRRIWRSTLYFMILISVSYEGFYGLLIPFMVKVSITAIVGLLIVYSIARALGHRTWPVAGLSGEANV